jgi:hypothetical protein
MLLSYVTGMLTVVVILSVRAWKASKATTAPSDHTVATTVNGQTRTLASDKAIDLALIALDNGGQVTVTID